MQLHNNILISGGSDGRVIIFSIIPSTSAPQLASQDSISSVHSRFSIPSPTTPPPASPQHTAPKPFSIVQRLAAHDSSVTGLQFDSRFLVTGGNDGRVRLFEFRKDAAPAEAGGGIGGKFEYVREMSDPCESVWKVAYTEHTCAIICKRAGKTLVEIWSFRPDGLQAKLGALLVA